MTRHLRLTYSCVVCPLDPLTHGRPRVYLVHSHKVLLCPPPRVRPSTRVRVSVYRSGELLPFRLGFSLSIVGVEWVNLRVARVESRLYVHTVGH